MICPECEEKLQAYSIRIVANQPIRYRRCTNGHKYKTVETIVLEDHITRGICECGSVAITTVKNLGENYPLCLGCYIKLVEDK